MRIFLSGMFLWIAVAVARADDVTNPVPPVAALSVSNCLDHLDLVVARIEVLAESVTNDAVRAKCIADKLNKARSLHDLVENLNDTLELHEADEADEEELASVRSLIMAACPRIDKLAEDAAACQASVLAKARRAARPAAANAPRPRVVTEPTAPASTIRDETTCVKQATFATLLADVMEVGYGKGADAASRELATRDIEPLNGWSGDDCLTVDDLCVVVARALKLRVEVPTDPYSYVQAVRQDGLPVDSVLPKRRREATPALLLETEVRVFLARGYAARLPSSRRVQPD